MHYGISFLPDAAPETKTPRDYFADALALSVIADRAGLHTVKMTEHYLHPYGGYCPSPLAFLAAVAAQTQHIRLMTGCVLAAFHHPVQIAAEAAMVDAISGGRLDLGLARAYLPYEFAAFGVSMDDRRERFGSTLGAVRRLWTERSVDDETRFWTLRQARSLPPPTQRPHPPIWVAAVRSRQSFAWIGEQGLGLLISGSFGPLAESREMVTIYRESFVPGPAGDHPRVAFSLPLYVAPDDRTAIEEGDRYLARYFGVWADAAESWAGRQSTDYAGYTGLGSVIRSQTPSSLRRTRNAIVGSPERVRDELRALTEALPVDEILWQIDFGAMPLPPARRTLELFAEEVAE